MKWLAAYAARLWPRSALAGRGIGANWTRQSAGGSSPARRACPLQISDGELPAMRLALMLESRQARNLRQSKLTALCEADLKALPPPILSKGR